MSAENGRTDADGKAGVSPKLLPGRGLRPLIGQPTTLREHNRALILNALRRTKTLSRADLARELGLAMSTVSRLVEELISARLVEEDGKAGARGGRPATLLRLHRKGACVIGADLSRQGIQVVVADLRGHTLASAEREHGPTPEDDMATVVHELSRLLADLDVDRDRVLGMGIGVPGQVDTEKGLVVERPSHPAWSFLPIRDRLTALLGMPVVVENNVSAAAYGEYLSSHHDVRTLVYAHAGAGIGTGIVLNGQIHRGRTNTAGQIAHVTIDSNGPICWCGRNGCVVGIATTDAMADAFLNRDTSLPPVEPTDRPRPGFVDLLAAEKVGDNTATKILSEGGRAFGIALENLVSILDPDLVILGGHAVTSPVYYEAALDELHRRAWGSETTVNVELSRFGPNTIALGAALMMLHRIFDPLLAR